MTRNILSLTLMAMAVSTTQAQGPTATLSNDKDGASWALVADAEGRSWSLDIESELVNLGGRYYDDWRYVSQHITAYDPAHQTAGSFTIDVSGTNANDVSVFSPLTQHLFNADDQWEVCTQIHIPGNADNGYVGQQLVRAYSLDGTLVFEAEGQAVIQTCGTDARLFLTRQQSGGLMGQTVTEVYQPGAEGLILAHTFTVDNMLAEYACGPSILPVSLSDGIHCIVAHYEKPLPLIDENGEQQYDPVTWMPVWTPDNYYVIEHYGPDYQLLDELWIPTTVPDGMMARLMGIGSMSDVDVSEGYFTADGKYNYIVMCEDTNEEWNTEYTFEVYTQGGNHQGTLFAHCGDYWNRLSTLPGLADQWIFLGTDAETEMQQLTVVDASTLQPVCRIPALLDGRMISTNMDRVPHASDGYQYVIALNEPSTDESENVISHYGYYHPDLSLDHYVSFNMGPRAETFSPLVNEQTLCPTLFCNDPQREYLFMTKQKADDGQLYSALYLGNDAGEVLHVWTAEGTTRGDIQGAGILGYGTSQPELFVCYTSRTTSAYSLEFYALPIFTTGLRTLGAGLGNAVRYNLQGQRLCRPAQGFSISGGKVAVQR